jgi:hypothetical protein
VALFVAETLKAEQVNIGLEAVSKGVVVGAAVTSSDINVGAAEGWEKVGAPELG